MKKEKVIDYLPGCDIIDKTLQVGKGMENGKMMNKYSFLVQKNL